MTPLAALAIQELPGIIAFLKSEFAKRNQGAPTPTDDDVKAAYLQAFASSIAVDDNWLAAHPVVP